MPNLFTRRLTLVAALVTAPLAAACSDALGPEDVAGTFALTTDIPTTSIGMFSVRVLADTFVLASDGLATRRTWVERTALSGGAPDVVIQRGEYDFRLEDRAIGFQPLCPSGQICAAMAYRIWYDLDPVGRQMRPRDDAAVIYVRLDSDAP